MKLLTMGVNRMWRLNVRAAQIDACLRESMFAIHYEPKNPPLVRGDILLLQLVKDDARDIDQLNGRITFAIIFDHLASDADGSISRAYWPLEGREWPWIIYGSATIPTLPVSLENLGLSRDYSGQTNPVHIAQEDEEKIFPYIQWSVPHSAKLPIHSASDHARVLTSLQKRSQSKKKSLPDRQLVETQKFDRDIWLAEALKAFYGYRCQVCGFSYTNIYGVSYAETHHITYLREGGSDTLENMIVLCPNHHRLVHATRAWFDRKSLAYNYPNGMIEELQVKDHFLDVGERG